MAFTGLVAQEPCTTLYPKPKRLTVKGGEKGCTADAILVSSKPRNMQHELTEIKVEIKMFLPRAEHEVRATELMPLIRVLDLVQAIEKEHGERPVKAGEPRHVAAPQPGTT